MFKNNALYYVWHNDLTACGRKLTKAMLLRTFIEYSAYFMLLLQHHTIAMHLFHSKEWFPATLYFEGCICMVKYMSVPREISTSIILIVVTLWSIYSFSKIKV